MKTWEPISLKELQEEIQNGVNKMTVEQLNIWNKISMEPKKWMEADYGDEGGGFWVVGINENKVVYYNNIEEGFNISTFTDIGVIDEYRTEQDELHSVLQKLIIL